MIANDEFFRVFRESSITSSRPLVRYGSIGSHWSADEDRLEHWIKPWYDVVFREALASSILKRSSSGKSWGIGPHAINLTPSKNVLKWFMWAVTSASLQCTARVSCTISSVYSWWKLNWMYWNSLLNICNRNRKSVKIWMLGLIVWSDGKEVYLH